VGGFSKEGESEIMDKNTKMPLLFFKRDDADFVFLGEGTLDHIQRHESLDDYIGRVLPFHFDELPDAKLVEDRTGWVSPSTSDNWSRDRPIYEFEFLKTEKRTGQIVITKRVQ
jgi:hypothetical protein